VDRSVYCLGWNVTVRPPGYAPGQEQSAAELEAALALRRSGARP
jgi:hypothetical protein